MSDGRVIRLAALVVAQLPDSPPVAPPGSEQITLVIGYLRWLALAGIVACFVSGLVMFTEAGCSTTSASAGWGPTS